MTGFGQVPLLWRRRWEAETWAQIASTNQICQCDHNPSSMKKPLAQPASALIRQTASVLARAEASVNARPNSGNDGAKNAEILGAIASNRRGANCHQKARTGNAALSLCDIVSFMFFAFFQQHERYQKLAVNHEEERSEVSCEPSVHSCSR